VNRLLQINWTDLQYSADEFSREVYTFPLHIRILIGITLTFVVVVIVLLAVILGSRIHKTRRARTREELRRKYQPVFMELLFGSDEPFSEQDPKRLFDPLDLQTPFHQEILLEETIHLHENFSGETAARLELLFVKLGFHEVSKRRLREKRWDKVAKGMRELSLMNVREAEPLISPFLKSKNDILRKEARVALVNLSVKDHLSFLSRETEPLTDWDQAVIYSMMSKMPELSIPDFSAWLDSKNPTVVEFCISMIGAFRQQESLPILIRLLNDPVEKRKLLAIRALRELGAAAAEQPLLDLYPSANSEMRREILRTLEVIGSERSLQPIHQLLLQPVSDLPLAIQAVRSLLATGPRGVQLVEQLSVHGDPKIQQVIRHARDKRL
jgi:HEAT repeat protein